MESFYSVIYLKTNALTDEHLSVGLFTGGGEGPFLFLSEPRLKLYKEITHKNTFLAIRRLLQGLKNEVDKYRGNQSELRLFDPLYSKEELVKLKKISKGTVLFSEPTVINDWLNHELHEKLVQQFLGEQKKKALPRRSAFHLQWNIYVKQPRFDAYSKNSKTNELLKGVDVAISVDLYHSKKKEVVKAIDFDMKTTTLDRKLYELNLLMVLFKGKNVICVYPTPKTKIGKEQLEQSIISHPKVTFYKFRSDF
jgi:hypothetical protein